VAKSVSYMGLKLPMTEMTNDRSGCADWSQDRNKPETEVTKDRSGRIPIGIMQNFAIFPIIIWAMCIMRMLIV